MIQSLHIPDITKLGTSNIARSSNGRTTVFGAVYHGSSPCLATLSLSIEGTGGVNYLLFPNLYIIRNNVFKTIRSHKL